MATDPSKTPSRSAISRLATGALGATLLLPAGNAMAEDKAKAAAPAAQPAKRGDAIVIRTADGSLYLIPRDRLAPFKLTGAAAEQMRAGGIAYGTYNSGPKQP